MASITNDQIHQAAEQLGSQEPAWAERYGAGARLLINGGWERHTQFVTFPGGIVCQPGGCSCQEGTGPIVCIHRVALAILDHAATHCTDCGAQLVDHTLAQIGLQLRTICRSCHAARSSAGRQRQKRIDLRMIGRVADPGAAGAGVAPC
jgi:hypothetical protein